MSHTDDNLVFSTATFAHEDLIDVPALPNDVHLSVVDRLNGEKGSGRYETKGEVGRGGMGRVISVHDRDLNRRVAMKTLITDKKTSRQFVEEAQVSAQLEHPNVLPVYDFGVNADGNVYFTMKYVEGHETLRAVIDRLKKGDPATQARYTFERRVQVIQQVCNALSYAHARGVCHRDIKPDNVIVGPSGEVYLADWGIAQLKDKTVPHPLSGPMSEGRMGTGTKTGTRLAGTLAYMSPERLAGTAPDFDPAGDIYSLVAVLYELLTLHHYVNVGTARTREDMQRLVAQNKYVEAKRYEDPVHGAVPPAPGYVCRVGLSKDPSERYSNATALADALQMWVEGRAPVVCPRTFIQSVLCKYGRFVNRFRIIAPVVTFMTILIVGACVVYTLATLLMR